MSTAAAPVGSPQMVTGLFRARAGAERACDIVVARGYEPKDISVVMSDETRAKDFARTARSATPDAEGVQGRNASIDQAVDGAKMGGPVGGTLGTLAPAVAAAGTLLLIPGLIFAGPVMVALAAAGAVGITGGLIGALANWGVPKDRVEEYDAGIRAGGILLGVKPHSADDARYFEEQWRSAGGEVVHS
jgi:hypothetical protein